MLRENQAIHWPDLVTDNTPKAPVLDRAGAFLYLHDLIGDSGFAVVGMKPAPTQSIFSSVLSAVMMVERVTSEPVPTVVGMQ